MQMSALTQKRLELTTPSYTFTRVGLIVTGETSEGDWQLMGEGLKAVDEARQWAIGDWLCDGKRHYGDGLYKKAAEATGLEVRYMENLKQIADQFEITHRCVDLSWAHHRETVSIKPIVELDDGTLALGTEPDHDKIAEFLADAVKHNWSVADLRGKVREYKEWQREKIRLANEPDKFSVIYADPPWQYNSGDQHGTEEQDTVLGDHYPSMSLNELCQMPVKQMAATDAILFMWVTSPTLEEAFEVINAWGFDYKASMVWDKVAHNVGNYVSVRHEMLLICKRGQPPKVPKLVDSVYEEERTEHSRKPAYFRELIDELYPDGKRIELFAREVSEGWECWGNEVAK
jgi:N6-adenosine-specific RNA methylase IME4